jgi:hypothetical protein
MSAARKFQKLQLHLPPESGRDRSRFHKGAERFLLAYQGKGLTDEELALSLRTSLANAKRYRNGVLKANGLVKEVGLRRMSENKGSFSKKSPKGNFAKVWGLTVKGVKKAEQILRTRGQDNGQD